MVVPINMVDDVNTNTDQTINAINSNYNPINIVVNINYISVEKVGVD